MVNSSGSTHGNIASFMGWILGGTIINRRANLDKAINPKGIHIGDNCRILANVVILTHDACRNLKTDTYIGSNTIIGIRCIILAGIKIGYAKSNVGTGDAYSKLQRLLSEHLFVSIREADKMIEWEKVKRIYL